MAFTETKGRYASYGTVSRVLLQSLKIKYKVYNPSCS